MPGTCSDFPGGFCGKCDDDFESSSCESFFLSKNGPVKGGSNVFASGSYSPEKPVDLERIPTFTSHFKRGHHLRDYKGTGTYGWLSGIAPVGPTSTAGSNARLEFVNNQFPYIQGDTPTDIDYIGLCDKRRAAKHGCATIKFKNTVVGSTTTKVDKFHLKIGTFQRYGDTARLNSVLFANNQVVPAKYIGPFTSASEHMNKFNSVCENPADAVGRGGNGTVLEGIAHIGSSFNLISAHCYGDLPMACCASLTKSISAEYEFDVSSFPIDTCFTLYNFANVGTSSSSYGYFELTGESPNFFETSTPTFDQNFPDCTAGFFSDNFPGCRFDTPGFNCDPPPPPPPPTTTTTTLDPCPPDSPSVIHCRYDYIESNSADDPPGHKKWRRKGFPSNSNCECNCPSIAQIANEWNSANGGEPQIGQCADAYVPCCKPNLPSSCLDYTITFNPECGTTTTTTEGPTTTTTANPLGACCTYFAIGGKFISCEENVLFSDCCINDDGSGPDFNGFCFESDGIGADTKKRKHHPGLTCAQASCDDDQPFFVVVCHEPLPCAGCPEKTQETRSCVEFPNKAQADAYASDLQSMGLTPIKGPGACDDATFFTCKSCDDSGPCTTTTTAIPTTTTTTAAPTTTTTQAPTTTTTEDPLSTTTTTTEDPANTTTTTAAPALGCCRDCASDCCGYGIFYQDVTEEFCDGIGGAFSSDCFITSLLAPCCVSQLPGAPCEGTPCSSCDPEPDSPPAGGGGGSGDDPAPDPVNP